MARRMLALGLAHNNRASFESASSQSARLIRETFMTDAIDCRIAAAATSDATHSTVASPARRKLLSAAIGGAALGLIGAPAVLRAQSAPKVRIGYWPVAAGLPFFAA